MVNKSLTVGIVYLGVGLGAGLVAGFWLATPEMVLDLRATSSNKTQQLRPLGKSENVRFENSNGVLVAARPSQYKPSEKLASDAGNRDKQLDQTLTERQKKVIARKALLRERFDQRFSVPLSYAQISEKQYREVLGRHLLKLGDQQLISAAQQLRVNQGLVAHYKLLETATKNSDPNTVSSAEIHEIKQRIIHQSLKNYFDQFGLSSNS